MIPPVSLPLNGGTQCRPAPARPPASRPSQPGTRPQSFASQTPFRSKHTIERASGHGKNGCGRKRTCLSGVAALHLTLSRASRHRPTRWIIRRIPMRNLFTSLRSTRPLAPRSALLGLLAFGQAAQAANPLELNFWLSGPRYDGRVARAAKRRCRPSPRNSRKRKAPSGIPRWRSPAMAGSTKPRSGPGSPTTSRAAIAAAT